MKTLIIAYKYPLPENGGDRIRTMHFVRFYKKKGDVDVLYFHRDQQVEETGDPFSNAYYVDIYKGSGTVNKVSHYYEKLKFTKPWAVPDYTHEARNRVADIVAAGNYDTILCRYALNAFPLFFLPHQYRKNVVVDIDDMISSGLYASLQIDHKKAPSNVDRLKSFMDFKFYQSYQKKCARLNKSIICSESDES